MNLCPAAVSLIKGREGCRLAAYRCPAGIWTIGYGHTGPEVHEGLTVTQDQADALLQGDLLRFDTIVGQTCPVATEGQHGAMVSLCYNIGCDAFSRSSVARLHNAGRYGEAAQAFALWNKAAGHVLTGLVARRAAEAALYLSGPPEALAEDLPTLAEGERSLSSSRTIGGGGIAATATGATIAAEAVRQTSEWRDALTQVLPYFDELRWVLLGLTILGVTITIYARISDRWQGRN